MQTCLFSSRQNRLSALNYLPVLSQPRRLCPNYQSALNYLSVPSRPWRSILNCLPVLLRPRRPFMNSLSVPVMAMEVVPELFFHPELSVYPVTTTEAVPLSTTLPENPICHEFPPSLPLSSSTIFCPVATASCQSLSSSSALHLWTFWGFIVCLFVSFVKLWPHCSNLFCQFC